MASGVVAKIAKLYLYGQQVDSCTDMPNSSITTGLSPENFLFSCSHNKLFAADPCRAYLSPGGVSSYRIWQVRHDNKGRDACLWNVIVSIKSIDSLFNLRCFCRPIAQSVKTTCDRLSSCSSKLSRSTCYIRRVTSRWDKILAGISTIKRMILRVSRNVCGWCH